MTKQELLALCNCEECPYKESPTKVFGIGTAGDFEYEVAFVGMAPAREELIEGEPFVGWSGKALRGTAKKLGFLSFYLTNTLLCPIPESATDAATTKAATCCKARLLAELESIKPKLTIVLGNLPLRTLSGSQDIGIMSVEGRIIPGPVSHMLPITHPASYAPDKKGGRVDDFIDFVDAMRSGVSWLDGTYQQAIEPETIVVNEDNIADILQRIENAGNPTVDLETTGDGLYPYKRNRDKIRCAAVAIEETLAYIFPGYGSPNFAPHANFIDDDRVRTVLNNCECDFHKGVFDCGFLWAEGYTTQIAYDTMLAHYLMDEREYSHGLKELSIKKLGAEDWESEMRGRYLKTKNASFDLIPDDPLYFYASKDVCYTRQLKKMFMEDVSPYVPGIYRDLILPAANMFIRKRHKGLRIDGSVLLTLGEDLDTQLEEIEDEINKLADDFVNPSSPQQVAELLFDKMGLPIDPEYGRSTDKAVLEAFKGIPVVDKIREFRELRKLRGAYVDNMGMFLDYDVRVHPETKIHGTVTGRLSTEKPSIMNIPRKGPIKNLFLPEPYHYWLECDQKQMELRCYAILANDEYAKQLLIDSITDKSKDPHSNVGNLASQMSGREISRIVAKSAVFGKLYGRGVDSFARGFGLSFKDASALMNAINTVFPGLPGYEKETLRLIKAQGYLESYFGRRRRFPLVTRQVLNRAARQGVNFGPSSMASDLNLACMLELDKPYWVNRTGADPLFPVHDAVDFDLADPGTIKMVAKRIEEFSREIVNGEMQFAVESKLGRSWGSCKEVE